MAESSEIILYRNYRLKNGRDVVLLVRQPMLFGEGPDFKTEYLIRGLGDEQVRFAGGIDAIQSMLLALKMAAAFLVTSDEYRSGQLYWLEKNDSDLGLPLPDSLRDSGE